MEIATTVTTVLVALVAAASGIPKVIGMAQTRAEAEHLGVPRTGYVVIGALEIAAGAGLLVGLAWPPLAVAAAVGLVLMMLGAVTSHVRVRDRFAAMVPALVVGALAAAALALRLAGL
ncbi:MAG: DoxX family protein [Streptomyces sp.]|uniref:DoxX family protein n=1 Tax=Streptomyces sp. TaxID=1931 RepID=UPI003D6B796C